MTQGLATLEVIDRDNIQENARVVGAHLKGGCWNCKSVSRSSVKCAGWD